jgi:hypothetical protein
MQFFTFVKNKRRQFFNHQRFQFYFITVLFLNYLVGSVPTFAPHLKKKNRVGVESISLQIYIVCFVQNSSLQK